LVRSVQTGVRSLQEPGPPSLRFFPMETTIVLVELPRDSETNLIVRDGPVFVLAPQPFRSGVYESEPEAVAQFYADESVVKFQAKWVDEHWVIGKRLLDS
jgi:hypothetical protein